MTKEDEAETNAMEGKAKAGPGQDNTDQDLKLRLKKNMPPSLENHRLK